AGLGAEGVVGSARVVLGNHRLFEERRLCSDAVHTELDAVADGSTPVLVARDGTAVGVITVADRPRDGAKDVIALLRSQGIEAVVMLPGDNEATAQAVARDLGVTDVRANLLPQDKVAAVEAL